MHRHTLAAVLLLLAPLGAANAQRSRADRERDRDRTSIDTTFAFDRTGTVTLTLGGGDIVVTSWSRDQIRVHATSDDGDLRLDGGARRVALELGRARGGDDARFEITVPVGVRIIARAESGDIAISGTKGGVDARSQSGDIRVDDAADRVDVSTLSGDVVASALAGDVQINSVSGDVRVTGFKGDFEAESVSGSISLRSAVARYVRTHTTSGDLVYEGSIDANGRYELVTHSGDVRLGMPSDAGAQISISTWSGAVESDFPITLKPGEHGIGATQSKRFTFEIGNGAARVTAETFSGDITISSRGPARRAP